MENTTPKWLKICIGMLAAALLTAGLSAVIFATPTTDESSEPQAEEAYAPTADEFDTAAEENPL